MLTIARWLSSLLWRTKGTGRARLLPPIHPLKEEPIDWYRPGRFHPVKLGDVYGIRYEVLRKLGWGICSTVWLARDLEANRHVALKILSADVHGYYDSNNEWKSENRTFEREVLQSIAASQSHHAGRGHTPRLLDCFEHRGPHGKHDCLVLPVLGRSLYEFSTQWKPSRVPAPIMRQIMIQLLRAVDFLHQEMRMIHTDIKDTNILFDLNCHDPGFPQDYWIQQLFDHAPVPTGISYPTFDYVQSKSIFAPVEGPSHVYIQLGDFGSACWKDKHLAEYIQPPFLRAPEVLLVRPWSTPVDIWSIGVTLLEHITGRPVFRGETLRDQLAQIAACLGSFPEDLTTNVVTSEHLFNLGTTCEPRDHAEINLETSGILTSEQLFNPDGSIKTDKKYTLDPLNKAFQGSPLEPSSESPLSEEERRDLITFLRSMLQLSPQTRKSAGELLQDSWLRKEYEYPEYESQ